MEDPKERMWREAENAQIEASPKNGPGCLVLLVLIAFFGFILWIAYR
jgi:hypothetical protein